VAGAFGFLQLDLLLMDFSRGWIFRRLRFLSFAFYSGARGFRSDVKAPKGFNP
jgi:hypothetical protein